MILAFGPCISHFSSLLLFRRASPRIKQTLCEVWVFDANRSDLTWRDTVEAPHGPEAVQFFQQREPAVLDVLQSGALRRACSVMDARQGDFLHGFLSPSGQEAEDLDDDD